MEDMSSLETFKEFIAKEFQKITTELKRLCQDYKSIDCHFTMIEGKLGHIESFTTHLQTVVHTVKEKVDGLEGKIRKVEHLAQHIDEDLKDFSDDFEVSQINTETIDNYLWKNNFKLRGLKDAVEGEDLRGM